MYTDQYWDMIRNILMMGIYWNMYLVNEETLVEEKYTHRAGRSRQHGNYPTIHRQCMGSGRQWETWAIQDRYKNDYFIKCIDNCWWLLRQSTYGDGSIKGYISSYLHQGQQTSHSSDWKNITHIIDTQTRRPLTCRRRSSRLHTGSPAPCLSSLVTWKNLCVCDVTSLCRTFNGVTLCFWDNVIIWVNTNSVSSSILCDKIKYYIVTNITGLSK